MFLHIFEYIGYFRIHLGSLSINAQTVMSHDKTDVRIFKESLYLVHGCHKMSSGNQISVGEAKWAVTYHRSRHCSSFEATFKQALLTMSCA